MSSSSVLSPPPLPDNKEADLLRREIERRLKETVRERLGLPGGSKLHEDGNVTTSEVVKQQQRLHQLPSRDDLNLRPMDQRGALLHDRINAVDAARSKYVAVRRWQQRDRQRRRGREGLTINTPTTEDTTTATPKENAPSSSDFIATMEMQFADDVDATTKSTEVAETITLMSSFHKAKSKTKQKYLIGTIVSETHAVQPFVGAITAYNPTEDLYTVKFEDGELRNLSEKELSMIMIDTYKGKKLLPPVVDDSSSITDYLTMTGSTLTSITPFFPPGVSAPGREAAAKQDDNVKNYDQDVGLSALIQAAIEKHRADTIRMLSMCATQGQSCVPSNTMTAQRYANLNALAAANQLVYRAGGHKLPYHDLKILLANAEEDALSSFQTGEMQQTIDIDQSDHPEELMSSEEEETEEVKSDEEDSDDEEESIQEEVESMCAWFSPISEAPANEAHSTTTSDFREKCSVAGSVIGTGAVGGAVMGASIVGAAPLVLVAAVLGASVWGASFLMLVTCNKKSSQQGQMEPLPGPNCPNCNAKSRYVAPDRIASSQASCNSSLPSLPLSYDPPVLEVHWEDDALANIAAE